VRNFPNFGHEVNEMFDAVINDDNTIGKECGVKPVLISQWISMLNEGVSEDEIVEHTLEITNDDTHMPLILKDVQSDERVKNIISKIRQRLPAHKRIFLQVWKFKEHEAKQTIH
jgi:L-fucose isomerase-like protein